MTREEAKEWIPIIQAFADGKTIEFFKQGEWMELNDPDFIWSAHKYRVKPEPKYRPFKTKEECWNEMAKHAPFGWLKGKRSGSVTLIGCVYAEKDKDVRLIWATNESQIFNGSSVFNDYVFADGTPFGMKEE